MTPEEFKAKLDKLPTLIVEKLAEPDDDPKWGTVVVRTLIAGCAEDFFFEVGDARVQLRVLHIAQLRLDCIDLTVECNDLVLRRLLAHLMLDVANVVGECR